MLAAGLSEENDAATRCTPLLTPLLSTRQAVIVMVYEPSSACDGL